MDDHIHTEMRDLVHLAEKWATSPSEGFNRVPQISVQELRAHRIGQQIITRAALKLLHQLGVKTPEDFKKSFGELKEKEVAPVVPVSPMSVGEFTSILEKGWTADSPNRRRTSMLTELVPLSPIASQKSPEEKAFAVPQMMARKSEAPPLSSRKLFTAKTPRARETPRHSMTPKRGEMVTPQRTMDRNSPPPLQGETPFENRASRLRRLKLEEKRQSIGGNSSMNSSFGC